MPISRALRRLLRIRELEEQQSRLALESALGELNRIETALASAALRDRRGRQMVASSAQTGALPDRIAGMEESRSAGQRSAALEGRRELVAEQAEGLQASFLARRVARRQAETLIESSKALDTLDAARREQQILDDWHRTRQTVADSKRQPPAAGRHETR